MQKQKIFRRAVLALLLVMLLPMPARASSAGESLVTQRQIYTYLTEELELNSAAACGILSNIEHESGFQTNVLGDGGTSFGLCQWHAGRYTALRNYCSAKNLDYRTVAGQMAYLGYELESSYSLLLTALKTVDNTRDGAYRAGYLWCTEFERPADMERKAVTRGNAARYRYWNRYNDISASEEEPEQPPEQVVTGLMQPKIEIPLPPEEPDRTSSEHYEVQKAEMKPYVPRHAPCREKKSGPAIGVAVGIVFLGLGERALGGYRLPRPDETQEEVPMS